MARVRGGEACSKAVMAEKDSVWKSCGCDRMFPPRNAQHVSTHPRNWDLTPRIPSGFPCNLKVRKT